MFKEATLGAYRLLRFIAALDGFCVVLNGNVILFRAFCGLTNVVRLSCFWRSVLSLILTTCLDTFVPAWASSSSILGAT